MGSKNIRIAMLAPPWLPIPPSGYGGIENVIDAIVPELMKMGAEVELFTTGDSTVKCTKMHYLYEKGQYEHIHKPYYSADPINYAHILHAIDIIRKDGTFDVIHDHNPYVGPSIFANAHDDIPPVIHTLHGPPFTTPDRLEADIPDNLPMWQHLGGSRKVYFVGISDAYASTAPEELKPRILPTVYNSVHLRNFPFSAKKGNYFITLARFTPDKGQKYAIQAAMELGVPLKMAGVIGALDTPRKIMRELANPQSQYRHMQDFRYFSDYVFPFLEEDNISYIGGVSGPTKMDFIKRAKALLFPIQWDEPFGMAVIEALACGTPVIAMKRGAMPELIEHGVNGFLANDYDEFKHYMTRINEIDPRACRLSVKRKFSAPVTARHYLQRYKSVIRWHHTAARKNGHNKHD